MSGIHYLSHKGHIKRIWRPERESEEEDEETRTEEGGREGNGKEEIN